MAARNSAIPAKIVTSRNNPTHHLYFRHAILPRWRCRFADDVEACTGCHARERKGIVRGRRAHSRQCTNLFQQPLKEVYGLDILRIFCRGKVNACHHHIARIETRVHRRKFEEASDQQARACEQHEGHADLRNGKYVPQTMAARACFGAPSFPQRIAQIRSCRVKGRDDTEQQARQ